MADINQQTEELARIMEQVNREMAYYGQITKATADQKRDAEIEAATGMKNFTKASGTAADAVGHLADAGMAAGKAMLEGKKGAAAFNDSIDGLTKAATAAGVALTLLVPGGVIIKGVIAGFTALTAATAGMVKASNEMADKIYKGYSGLAKSGAAASDVLSSAAALLSDRRICESTDTEPILLRSRSCCKRLRDENVSPEKRGLR